MPKSFFTRSSFQIGHGGEGSEPDGWNEGSDNFSRACHVDEVRYYCHV